MPLGAATYMTNTQRRTLVVTDTRVSHALVAGGYAARPNPPWTPPNEGGGG